MAASRILVIAHGHPNQAVGGAEIYAHEFFLALKNRPGFDATYLARAPHLERAEGRGTPFRAASDDWSEVLWTPSPTLPFLRTLADKREYRRHFGDFLETYRPDVVHIQHLEGLGWGLVRQIRNTLPGVPIVMTMHEFLPICEANGQMVTTETRELCEAASPEACHRCFPHISPDHFLLREQFIKSHLRLVDRLVTPSWFLRQRYIEWGIDEQKIEVIENGQELPKLQRADDPPVEHFGFFGQIYELKGILTLLEAIRIVGRRHSRRFRFFINGANLRQQEGAFRDEFFRLVEACGDRVVLNGRFKRAELAERMQEVAWVIVPSLWWENSPLVIQEAFMYRRPVICTNLGGMAEKVTHRKSGLHFKKGVAADLAEVLLEAGTDKQLWETLRAGIPPVLSLEAAVDAHLALYEGLMQKEAAR